MLPERGKTMKKVIWASFGVLLIVTVVAILADLGTEDQRCWLLTALAALAGLCWWMTAKEIILTTEEKVREEAKTQLVFQKMFENPGRN